MTTPLELLANYVTTSVTSGGTTAPPSGTVETWTVSSSTGFPVASSGGLPPTQFRCYDVINTSEIVIVTNVAGTTWTVTRGAEGTVPVAHLSGFDVSPIVSAGALTSSTSGVAVAALNARGNLIASIIDGGGAIYNVKAYGATGNGIIVQDGVMSMGSTTLTSGTGIFTSADVGKQIVVNTAGSVGSLTSALTAGNVYTALSTTAITTALSSGASVALGFGATTQVVTLSAAASAGATSLSVNSFTAKYNMAVTTPIDAEPLVTTIATVVSGTDITLSAPATIPVDNVQYAYGANDAAAVQSAISAAAPSSGIVYFPPGTYLVNLLQTPAQSSGKISFLGAGKTATTIHGNLYGGNYLLNLRMPGSVRGMTIDANQASQNGLLFSTSMVGVVNIYHGASATDGSTTITLNGNHAVPIPGVISVTDAGTPLGYTAGTSAPLTSNVVSVTYNSGPNTTSVVVGTAAGTTVSGKNAAYGSALIPISEWVAEDIRVQNIAGTSQGYGIQVNDGSASFPFQIDTFRLGNVTVGPSYSTFQEAVNLAFIHNCFISNLVMEGITGRVGPNFFAVDNLVLDGLILNLGGADSVDTVVFGQNYGALGLYSVNNLIINDPDNIAQPVLVYCSVLNASNWNLPSNGLCYVDLNQTGNNEIATFTNCQLGSGIKVSLSPMTLSLNGGSVGVFGTTGCISNPNTGATGPMFADGTIFDLTRATSPTIVYSTSSTVAPEVHWSNCKAINVTGTLTISNHGSTTGWISEFEGVNPVGPIASPPAVPASGTAVTNSYPYRVTVYVSDGGTGTSVAIGGTTVGSVLAGAVAAFSLSPGETITPTYTTAPTWVWIGE